MILFEKTHGSLNSSWGRAVFRSIAVLATGALAVSLGVVGSRAQAAPQTRQTDTPTPTATLPGLPPPPVDGGIVAVRDLTVYEGPGEQFETLGGLPYGAPIYPQARSRDTRWLRIEYGGLEGWVQRGFVDMGYDPVTLPLPGDTPASSVTPTPGLETPLPASPTPLPPGSATPEPAATSTSAADLAASVTDQPPVEAAEDTPVERPGSPLGLGPAQMAAIGAGALGVLLSVGYLLRGRRIAGGEPQPWVVERCPACQEGRLSVVDMGRSRRVVRCDNCRSVLRQVRKDTWRYAVDPLPDKDFAERYNGKILGEAKLVELAGKRDRRRVAPGD